MLSDSYRILAEIQAADPSCERSTVDETFEKAIAIATSQQAVSWELRARLAWSKFRQQSSLQDLDPQSIQNLVDRLERAQDSPDWIDAQNWLANRKP